MRENKYIACIDNTMPTITAVLSQKTHNNLTNAETQKGKRKSRKLVKVPHPQYYIIISRRRMRIIRTIIIIVLECRNSARYIYI